MWRGAFGHLIPGDIETTEEKRKQLDRQIKENKLKIKKIKKDLRKYRAERFRQQLPIFH